MWLVSQQRGRVALDAALDSTRIIGLALPPYLLSRAVDGLAGYQRMMLCTNDPLVTARRTYLAIGFRLVEEERRHSFGVNLLGRSYALDLHPGQASAAAPR